MSTQEFSVRRSKGKGEVKKERYNILFIYQFAVRVSVTSGEFHIQGKAQEPTMYPNFIKAKKKKRKGISLDEK